MAAVVLNIGKGRVAYYASLPAANDALIAVPLESTGLASDAVLRDCTTLDEILTTTTTVEQTFMGRKTLASVTSTVNNADDRVEVDAADVVWVSASGNPVDALLICYDPDTTAGDDTTVVPLVKLDFPVIPSGSDVTAVFPSTGFYWAT